MKDENNNEEAEYVMNYCFNCERETKHLIVGEKLLCMEMGCKIYNIKIEKPKEIKHMPMNEFYSRLVARSL